MKDALGQRMKGQYEDRTRYYLPRRTYTIIRVDGKAFHTLTRQYDRPFDEDMIRIMDNVALDLCQNLQNVHLAFVQSDEVSVLMTDFASPQTEAFFDGNIQKIVSVAASVATASFAKSIAGLLIERAMSFKSLDKFTDGETIKYGLFDARVFTVPDPVEVQNYFVWRQQDATRNSLQMVAQSMYSHKELKGKKGDQLHEMLFQKGVNWNNYPVGCKRGKVVCKTITIDIESTDGITMTPAKWTINEPPVFTQDPEYLRDLIPRMHEEDGV